MSRQSQQRQIDPKTCVRCGKTGARMVSATACSQQTQDRLKNVCQGCVTTSETIGITQELTGRMMQLLDRDNG